MEEFDLIVIGSGAGTIVASRAVQKGLQVALVDQGPTGGTCLNSGCIPSKMLIYPANVIRSIQDARRVISESWEKGSFEKKRESMKPAIEETISGAAMLSGSLPFGSSVAL